MNNLEDLDVKEINNNNFVLNENNVMNSNFNSRMSENQ